MLDFSQIHNEYQVQILNVIDISYTLDVFINSKPVLNIFSQYGTNMLQA